MRYDEYLAAGYPIGSGVAEGACRHLVKDRMEQTGMRWTVEGAQAMLHVRALYLNDQWEEFHGAPCGAGASPAVQETCGIALSGLRPVEHLLRPLPRRQRHRRRDADRVPGRDRRSAGARRPGAAGRAGAGRAAHAGRSPDRRAPGDADRRALRRLPRTPSKPPGRSRCTGTTPDAYLNRLAADCGFDRLADLNREALERWLAARDDEGAVGPVPQRPPDRPHRLRQLVRRPSIGRLSSNPFKGVPKADEKADPRRRRRAMTEAELVRLLDVARRRPLLEALTVRRGKRKGEAFANVRPEVRERLEAVGRERALIYKTLVLTGLRKSELASLTVAQLRLDGPIPHVELDAADEKNREGNGVVIRADLADDLRAWLADKLAGLQADARRRGEPIPARLPADTPVFDVPTGLVRIFDRDLKRAGIPKRDERGRTLDVHALRTTFGTLLSRGGVPLRTAQAAMRHSDPKPDGERLHRSRATCS